MYHQLDSYFSTILFHMVKKTHTHTHTNREKDRERERVCVSGGGKLEKMTKMDFGFIIFHTKYK